MFSNVGGKQGIERFGFGGCDLGFDSCFSRQAAL